MIEKGIEFAASTAVGLCAKKVAKNQIHVDTTDMKPGEKIITKVGEFAIISGLTAVAKTWAKKTISEIAIGLKCGKLMFKAKELTKDAVDKFKSDDYISDEWPDDVLNTLKETLGSDFRLIEEDETLLNELKKCADDVVRLHNDKVEMKKKNSNIVDVEATN